MSKQESAKTITEGTNRKSRLDWLNPFSKKAPIDAKKPEDRKGRKHNPKVGMAHPRVGSDIPDGTNLQSLYHFPNCEDTCVYEDSPTDWTDLVDTNKN